MLLEPLDVKETSAVRVCATSNRQYQSIGLPRPCGKIEPQCEDARLVPIRFRTLSRVEPPLFSSVLPCRVQGSSASRPYRRPALAVFAFAARDAYRRKLATPSFTRSSRSRAI